MNRLAQEKSPYLLQHAHNPVDWYPWGEEAFARAKAEDKPIFLSIGYSTCHWCHVMERESFENPEIAEMLNRSFISIKVDREEHPDVDQVYMRAVTVMTGQGGWPLTAILTPELKPFYGATYLPPERRWNMPGMKELLPAIAKAWTEQRPALAESADRVIESLVEREGAPAAATGLSEAVLDAAFAQAEMAFDPENGGFGDAPKFPRPHELSFLLHYYKRTGNAKALEMVETTLDAIRRGGIHDHLGGGIHRYSTDRHWLVPHFEKMLYDQALMARAAIEAFQITRKDVYADFARDILDYVLRDLRSPEGAFYAAEDADSEGEEGRFYVWTPAQIREIVGEETAQRFMRAYGVTESGNFEGGSSVLHEPAASEENLSEARAHLFAARNRRVRPHRDDKVLSSWNGLMIGAFAEAAAALDDPAYLAAAEAAAQFLLTRLQSQGKLLRRYRDHDARYAGTLEDYSFVADGLLRLYHASGKASYLTEADRLSRRMIDEFWDEADGGFWMRSKQDKPLISASKDRYDGATPSGNSVAAGVLIRLARFESDDRLESVARRTAESAQPLAQQAPFGYPQLLIAADTILGPMREIVLAGDSQQTAFLAMESAVRSRFLPRTICVFRPSGGRDAADLDRLAPWTKGYAPVDDRPTAYVCEGFVCRLPITDAGRLDVLLEAPWPAVQEEHDGSRTAP